MQELLEQLSQIAGKIKSLEQSREKLGEFLKEIKDKVEISGDEVLEKNLVYKVSADSLLNKKIVAIDGGVSQNTYHGLDLLLIKTVAVVSEYNKKLEKIDYYPSAFPTPKVVIISDPFSEEEFIINSSIERVKQEVSLAAQAAEKFSPDLLLLDGSIVPHSNVMPQKTSNLHKRYLELLDNFKKLYANRLLLTGCIEDSRARKFCELISREILSGINSPAVPELQKILLGTRDTNLLYHILDYGERTCVFRYGETPVLRDLEEFGQRIYAFYLKTAENDRPLRIEFYCAADNNPIETADKIASLVLALSCHDSYGFPAPLTEADVRARLREEDADALHDQLVDRVGITPSLMKLRRELRPL